MAMHFGWFLSVVSTSWRYSNERYNHRYFGNFCTRRFVRCNDGDGNIMEVRKGRSPSYVCSLDPQSCVDMEILNAIKLSVKVLNKDVKWESIDGVRGLRACKMYKRVRVKAREAIEKVNGRSYNWSGDLLGGLANAKRYDVYIHNDRRYK